MSSTALLRVVGLGTLRIRTARVAGGPVPLLGGSGELRECTLYGSVSVRGRRVGWHGACETVGRFRPRMPSLGACGAVGPEIRVEVLRPLLFEMGLLFRPARGAGSLLVDGALGPAARAATAAIVIGGGGGWSSLRPRAGFHA